MKDVKTKEYSTKQKNTSWTLENVIAENRKTT